MAFLRFTAGMLLLAAVACQGSPPRLRSMISESRPAPAPEDERSGDDRRTLRLATFNAGLAVGALEHAAERAPAVIQALEREAFDVLCVQEFWHDSHWRSLTDAVGDQLPQRLRPPPLAGSAGSPCTRSEIAEAEACVNRRCSGVPSTELALCAMRRCAKHALDLSSQCMGCLSRDPLRGAAEIFAECVEPADSRSAALKQRRTRPRAGAQARGEPQSYYYGGSSGLGLLIGPPIQDAGMLRLQSTMHPRAVLYARLGLNAELELHVFCTHLTPVLRSIPYPGPGSFEQEQARQIDALLGFIESKTGGNGKVILMGDLNTGPDLPPRITGRSPEHYARVIAHGFTNPYLEGLEPRCSYCWDNPISGGRGGGGTLIDHVLTRGFEGQARVRRLLDEPVSIVVGDRRVTAAYSDHYGVMVELGL